MTLFADAVKPIHWSAAKWTATVPIRIEKCHDALFLIAFKGQPDQRHSGCAAGNQADQGSALDFDIYLIDEGMPSTTDVEFNRKAGSILKDRLQHATIVVVSHQAETLEKFCRSAGVLLDGQLHMFDTLEEAKTLYDYQTKS